MSVQRQAVAEIILRVVPLVMRSLSLQLRQMEHGLRTSHYGVLFTLKHSTHNLTDLAEEMSVSLPTMSNTISTLEEYGWVERVRDPDDRRRVLVTLSEEGRPKLDKIQQQAIAMVADELQVLDDQDCEQLGAGLTSLLTCLCHAGHVNRELCPLDNTDPAAAQQDNT